MITSQVKYVGLEGEWENWILYRGLHARVYHCNGCGYHARYVCLCVCMFVPRFVDAIAILSSCTQSCRCVVQALVTICCCVVTIRL